MLIAAMPGSAGAAGHPGANVLTSDTVGADGVKSKKGDIGILTDCTISVTTPVRNGTRVQTTATVNCNGPVRRIDLAAALAVDGVVLQPWAVDTIGQTSSFSVTELQPCRTGIWQAGSQGRVYFLAGFPSVIDGRASSPTVSISC